MKSLITFLLLAGWQTATAQLSRDDVISLYQALYVESRSVPANWTGNIANCNAGNTSAAYQQAAVDVVNLYRVLAGLPSNVISATDQRVQQTQEAALIMAANNTLNHFPDASYTCYSAAGRAGAGGSNLALGASHIDAIDLYMDDPGSFNDFVGHRRWILYPRQVTVASGSVPRANALWVLGPFGQRVDTPNGVAWPPAGYVPYDLLPNRSNRWSFSFPNADFANSSVSMTGPSGAIDLTFEQLDNRGFGDRTLVWRPAGVNYQRPNTDVTYSIQVDNVRVDGQSRSFAYDVIVIDPTAATPPAPALFRDGFE